eukprot:156280-Chlamydomonas_euryale.AAC.1
MPPPPPPMMPPPPPPRMPPPPPPLTPPPRRAPSLLPTLTTPFAARPDRGAKLPGREAVRLPSTAADARCVPGGCAQGRTRRAGQGFESGFGRIGCSGVPCWPAAAAASAPSV